MGAAALPASAQTWQDTSLTATKVSPATFGGSNLTATNGTKVIALTGTNVTWSLHGTPPSGVSLSGATISNTGTTSSTTSIVADATDGTGNAEALVIPVALTSGSIQLGTGNVTKVSVSALADSNVSGTVKFTATSAATSINFAETNLPTGLSSGNPVLTFVGGTAAPGTYTGVVVTATDSDGAVLHGTFNLTVAANSVSDYGDEVNRFGNGFDVFRQHQFPGAIIAGWTATQGARRPRRCGENRRGPVGARHHRRPGEHGRDPVLAFTEYKLDLREHRLYVADASGLPTASAATGAALIAHLPAGQPRLALLFAATRCSASACSYR